MNAGAAPSFFKTPQGKLLIGLAGATLLVLALMVAALIGEAARTAPRFMPELVYPKLSVRLADAASVTIASKTGTIEIARQGNDPKDGRWVVSAAHDYPANAGHLRKLFLGLTELQNVEEKTRRPEWFAALGLDDPKEGGAATALTVKDSKGNALAALLVGKLRSPGGPNERPLVYVRRAGEAQTYLAAGELPLETERRDWLQSAIVDLARERVKRVTVSPDGAPGYTISRATAQTPNFALETLPKGREMLSATAANATGAAASEVTLDDVRPQGEVDFTKASRIAFETFDGLSLSFDVADKDQATWIRVSAQGTTPETVNEAAAIAARSGGWAYAVPAWKGTVFRKPLDTLLKTPEKTAKPK